MARDKRVTNRKGTSEGSREERLRAALRSNLQRRKTQARARSAGVAEASDAAETGRNMPQTGADTPALLAPDDLSGDAARLPRGSENHPEPGPDQTNEKKPRARPDGDKRQ